MKQACVNKDHVVVGGSTWNSMGLESTLTLCDIDYVSACYRESITALIGDL